MTTLKTAVYQTRLHFGLKIIGGGGRPSPESATAYLTQILANVTFRTRNVFNVRLETQLETQL